MVPTDYASAQSACEALLGSSGSLVPVSNIASAISATAKNLESFEVLASYRLDASHNETCFTDSEGDKVDLDNAEADGFAVAIPLSVETPQSLVIGGAENAVSPVDEGELVGTVCQYPAETPFEVGNLRPHQKFTNLRKKLRKS